MRGGLVQILAKVTSKLKKNRDLSIFTVSRDIWEHQQEIINKLESQLEKAEAVIKYYDDERNWDGWEIQGDDICYSDDCSEEGYAHGGKRAREYFKEKEAKP